MLIPFPALEDEWTARPKMGFDPEVLQEIPPFVKKPRVFELSSFRCILFFLLLSLGNRWNKRFLADSLYNIHPKFGCIVPFFLRHQPGIYIQKDAKKICPGSGSNPRKKFFHPLGVFRHKLHIQLFFER